MQIQVPWYYYIDPKQFPDYEDTFFPQLGKEKAPIASQKIFFKVVLLH